MEANDGILKAEEMIRKLKGLPPLPVVLSEALRLTADPLVSYDKVIKIISQDPSLSSRLLRIANSPYYGLKQRVTTLQLALVILGLREFRCILIGSALLEQIKSKNPQYDELYKKLWRESLFMASFCREFSTKLNSGYKGEDFLTGLLANMGALLLLNEMPIEYYKLIDESNNDHKKQLSMEQERLGFIHTDLATALLKQWDIPPFLCDSIWRQYSLEHLSLENAIDRKLSAILRLARYALIEINEKNEYGDAIQTSFEIIGDNLEDNKNVWKEIKQSKMSILTQSKINLDDI